MNRRNLLLDTLKGIALIAASKTLLGLAMWPYSGITFYGTVHSVTPAVFQAITASVLLFGAYCSWRVGGAADYSALFALMSTFFVGHFIEAYTGGYDFNVEYLVVPVLTVCAMLNPVPMKEEFWGYVWIMIWIAIVSTILAIIGMLLPTSNTWYLLGPITFIPLAVFIYRSYNGVEHLGYFHTGRPIIQYKTDIQSKWWAIGTLPFLLICAGVMIIPQLPPLAQSELLFIPTTLWLSLSTVGVITRWVKERTV